MIERFTDPSCVAVDIGNSRIKLGQFAHAAEGKNISQSEMSVRLPEPMQILDLPIVHRSGEFDASQLAAWCEQHLACQTQWLLASVHRAAAVRLIAMIVDWTADSKVQWPVRRLSYRDVPLEIRVEEPARVGIDRLLAAFAANRLRPPDRPAIIVDLGTAITVDLLDPNGAFAGGAILPGLGMSARALAEQTDALPHVELADVHQPPAPLGKSTVSAIESGLYWGAVGAIRELIGRLSAGLTSKPELFITGGAAVQVAELLSEQAPVHHVPHLVLAGIALVSGTFNDHK
jgi:type III pantothenate kinase